MTDYVREYFDSRASAWLEQAYLQDPLPTKYRIGDERVRVTIEGVAGAVPAGGSLVDLGCGGGQLCLHAARLGWKVTGIDVADGMIEEARRLCGDADVELMVAAFDDNDLPAGAFDAVTALGLIEYLPDDDGLLREASRLLRSGGRFAVSCRNRLYNVSSLNDYTLAEAERGAVGDLTGELATTLRGTEREALSQLAASLAEAAPELEEAMRLDESAPPPDLLDHPTAFVQERRQHTPAGIARRGRRGRAAARGRQGSAPAPAAGCDRARRAAVLQPARARVPASARGFAARPGDGVVVRRSVREGLSVLTIVMYHYVRDASPVPARTIEEFERQLDHLTSAYTIVRCADVKGGACRRTRAC